MRIRAGVAGILLATGIAATGAVFSAAPVLACSCGVGPNTAPYAFLAGARVFTGTVTQVDDPEGGGPLVSSARPVVVHLAVEKVYRGTVGASQTVRTVASPASCGFPFEVGQRYTVFADPASTGDVPAVGLCGGAVQGGIDPAAYGLGSGTSPPGTHETPLRTVLACAAVLALVGALVAVLRMRRNAAASS
jgi:hypothetical protein